MSLAPIAAAQANLTSVQRPNLVVVLTDDQDYALGGWQPTRNLNRVVASQGSFATNWFAHTPVCCPSRAQFLTGRYFHNLRMPRREPGGCMGVQTGVPGLEDKVSGHSFAKHLGEVGYTAAWLGKYLNGGACPKEPPPGYDCPTCRWFVNNGGEDTEPRGYLSANFFDFHGRVPTNDTYSRNGSYASWSPGAPVIDNMKVPQWAGYTTSIIANKSIEWLHQVAGHQAPRASAHGGLAHPFLLVLAPKAPHYAATPATWYEHDPWVDGHSAPRTPSYGVAPHQLAGHHKLIARQGELTSDERRAIDRLFRKRWKALLSVDDAVAGLLETLDSLSLRNTTCAAPPP